MVEDTSDGAFFGVPPEGGGHVQPNSGPVGVGMFTYEPSDQSVRIRDEANKAIKRIAEHRGVGKFLKLAETPGVYGSHPLGGCRMADGPGLGVVDDRCEVFNYEGPSAWTPPRSQRASG